jgi:S-DNA-T family DNA segregation ATPase FtsK/SpoIIIE
VILLSAKKQTVKNTTKNNSTRSKSARTSAQSKGRGASKAPAPKQPLLSPRIRAILFGTAALLFGFLIFYKGENIWTSIRGFFFGLFGMCIFLVPIVLIYLCVMTEKEKKVAHLKAKVVLCSLTILFVGALIYAASGAQYKELNFFACIGNLFKDCSDTTRYMTFGCGLLGGIIGYPLSVMFGSTATVIVSLLAILAIVFVLTGISIHDLGRAASRKMSQVRQAQERHAQMRRERRQAIEEERASNQYEDNFDNSSDNAKQKSKKKNAKTSANSLIDIPLDEPKASKRSKKKKSAQEEGIIVDVVDPNEENAADIDLSEDLINIINRAGKPLGKDAPSTVEDIAEDISSEKAAEQAENIQPENVQPDAKKPQKSKTKRSYDFEEEDSEIPELEDAGYKADNSSGEKQEKVYHYPPIQLLSLANNNNDSNAMEEMQNNAKKLIETLNSFGVKANITNICRGPSVTRYELQPAPGVKISKITNLADDIALNLAANGIRIEAPIPGKAAVGLEVPNKVVSMVSMRELIDSDKFRNSKSKLTAVLGKDISGEIVVTDLAKMPHLLIAGTTGSGKSVCVNSLLMSILYKATPDEVKLLLIDPKMVEFSKYKGIPHLLIPVVSDAKKAAGALAWAVNEMLQRYKIFSEFDCKDIDSYNALIDKNLKYIEENPPVENEEGELVQPTLEVNGLPVAKEKMSRVVIAIDELADLMMAAPSEVEDSICRLAQMARAAGMHLILATQRPTVNVITGLIKANVPSRIALKVSSNMDSRTILDAGGGEKLIGRGDMLFSPVGAPKPMRVQGCYASDEEIEGVTSYIKKSYSAQYNADIEESIKRIAAEEIATGKKSASSDSGSDGGLDVDSLMDEAIKCVIDAGQASTSLIQRRLKVGYARAGRMIDDMEQLGVVGPHQGSKPRDVLMTYNEWLERRNVLQNQSD